jgi:hypothetical protein
MPIYFFVRHKGLWGSRYSSTFSKPWQWTRVYAGFHARPSYGQNKNPKYYWVGSEHVRQFCEKKALPLPEIKFEFLY